MSTVVDMTDEDDDPRDPFGEKRIEVSEADLRKASFPAVYLSRVKTRLNEFATSITYGR